MVCICSVRSEMSALKPRHPPRDDVGPTSDLTSSERPAPLPRARRTNRRRLAVISAACGPTATGEGGLGEAMTYDPVSGGLSPWWHNPRRSGVEAWGREVQTGSAQRSVSRGRLHALPGPRDPGAGRSGHPAVESSRRSQECSPGRGSRSSGKVINGLRLSIGWVEPRRRPR